MSDEIRPVVELSDRHTFPIRPDEILSCSPWGEWQIGRFGKAEVEWAASSLVRFCKHRGGWYRFKLEELIAFYKETGERYPSLMLYGLLGTWLDPDIMGGWYGDAGYIVNLGDGTYCITEAFIRRCVAGTPLAERLAPMNAS